MKMNPQELYSTNGYYIEKGLIDSQRISNLLDSFEQFKNMVAFIIVSLTITGGVHIEIWTNMDFWKNQWKILRTYHGLLILQNMEKKYSCQMRFSDIYVFSQVKHKNIACGKICF